MAKLGELRNCNEARTLAAIRHALLPRLLTRFLHHATVTRHAAHAGPQLETMQDEARRFLGDHVARGYLAFQPALDVGRTGKSSR